ncbi:MAG: Uma2 family endonuclease [Gemmatimonadota bacterium]
MPMPQITWDDVQQLPDDGNRYEAIEGALYMTPAPSVRHQTISLRLALELSRLLVESDHGRLWYAPIGVRFPATQEGVQPDLVFVSNERRGIVAPDDAPGRDDLPPEEFEARAAPILAALRACPAPAGSVLLEAG